MNVVVRMEDEDHTTGYAAMVKSAKLVKALEIALILRENGKEKHQLAGVTIK